MFVRNRHTTAYRKLKTINIADEDLEIRVLSVQGNVDTLGQSSIFYIVIDHGNWTNWSR